MSDVSYDFLKKMDAGDFDQSLTTEIKKPLQSWRFRTKTLLSKEQLEEVANRLIKRDSESGLNEALSARMDHPIGKKGY